MEGVGAGVGVSLPQELRNLVGLWVTSLKRAFSSFPSLLEEAGCLVVLVAFFWKEALFATVSSPRIRATSRRASGGGGGGGGRGGLDSGRGWCRRKGEGRRGEGTGGEGWSSERRRRGGVFCGGEGDAGGCRAVGAGGSSGGRGGNGGQRLRLTGRRRAAGGGGSLYAARAAAATGMAMMATVARAQEAGNLTVPLTLRGLQYTASVTVSGTDYSAVSAARRGSLLSVRGVSNAQIVR